MAVGHSLGGVLGLMAAAADPKRFSALALVDPVVFTGVHSLFWGALKGLGFGSRLPLIRGARRRRESLPGVSTMFVPPMPESRSSPPGIRRCLTTTSARLLCPIPQAA